MAFIGPNTNVILNTFRSPNHDVFSGNNSQTQFTLSYFVTDEKNLEVVVNGSQLNPFDNSYTITNNGYEITFATPPSTGTNNVYVIYRAIINSHNVVLGPAQLESNVIASDKLQDNSVIESKILDRSVTNNKIQQNPIFSGTVIGVPVATETARDSYSAAKGNLVYNDTSKQFECYIETSTVFEWKPIGGLSTGNLPVYKSDNTTDYIINIDNKIPFVKADSTQVSLYPLANSTLLFVRENGNLDFLPLPLN